MAKFKPARGRRKASSGAPAAGLPCVILILLGMVLIMVFLYLVLRSSNA